MKYFSWHFRLCCLCPGLSVLLKMQSPSGASLPGLLFRRGGASPGLHSPAGCVARPRPRRVSCVVRFCAVRLILVLSSSNTHCPLVNLAFHFSFNVWLVLSWFYPLLSFFIVLGLRLCYCPYFIAILLEIFYLFLYQISDSFIDSEISELYLSLEHGFTKCY